MKTLIFPITCDANVGVKALTFQALKCLLRAARSITMSATSNVQTAFRLGTRSVVLSASNLAVLEKGIEVSRSCLEGVCGTCETVVLEGTPDHRDKVLSARGRASNTKMMICCSGSIGDRLVLDI
jgi:ferredoxin